MADDFRSEAARIANEQRQQIIQALAAIAAGGGPDAQPITKTGYVSHICKHCRGQERVPYTYTITTAAAKPEVIIAAAQALDKIGFGKPGDTDNDQRIDLSKDPTQLTPTERAALATKVDQILNRTSTQQN